MKIYFAGSIRGGREKQADYEKLCSYLKTVGNLLTEHVADKNLLSTGEKKDDKSIYTRDVAWINECDVVVAEVTVASLGVGYEIGYAESLKKNILCIYDQNINSNVSAMIAGNTNLKCIPYKNMDEAIMKIDDFLSNTSINHK